MSESVMIGLRKPKNVASKDFGEAGDRYGHREFT
jgi:hypothetical protein